MKKRIICALVAVLMIVIMLPIEAFATTTIKGLYVDLKFERNIEQVTGASSYKLNGTLPDGCKLEGTFAMNNNENVKANVLTLTLKGTPTKSGVYTFAVDTYEKNKTTGEKYFVKPPCGFRKNSLLFTQKLRMLRSNRTCRQL